jgi:hypothetical protein
MHLAQQFLERQSWCAKGGRVCCSSFYWTFKSGCPRLTLSKTWTKLVWVPACEPVLDFIADNSLVLLSMSYHFYNVH